MGVSWFTSLFAATSLFSTPQFDSFLFPISGLFFFLSVLFSPLQALPSSLPFIWQRYFWAKQREEAL